MYNALIARFLSQDPIGIEGGDVNLYRYVRNNPVNASDPSGLLETDDRPTAPGNAALVEVGAKLEKLVNGAIAVARRKVEWGVSKLPKNDRPPPADQTEMIIDEVYKQLGQDVPGTGYFVGPLEYSRLTGIEYKLKVTLRAADHEINPLRFADSRYRDNPIGPRVGRVTSHKTVGTADHSISPTIKVGGVLMGTDKWGHFFQQGRWLREGMHANPKDAHLSDEEDRENYSRWLEGAPIPEKYRTRILLNRFERFPEIAKKFGGPTTEGFFGAIHTGVISYADIAANEAGYQFYVKLSRDPWRYEFQVKDFPLPKFNEALNPSEFVKGVTTTEE